MIAALIEAALRAVLVALAAGVLLHLFRVNNVLAQKAAWGLVLAASVAMPLLMRWQWLPASVTLRLPAPASRLARESSPAEAAAPVTAPAGGKPLTSQAQFSVAAEPVPTSGDRFPAPTVSKQEFDAPVSMRSAQAQPESAPSLGKFANPQAGLLLLQPTTLAVFLYLAVLAALLLRMMYGLASAIRLWLAAQPCAPETGIDSGTDPARGLRLRSSPALSSPVTIGSGVVLPADYPEWDAEKLRIVLAHERSHVRQGDFYLQMLAGLYAAVFWFSPLGWWLKRKLSDLGEAISDRAGLEEAQSRTSYAQVLLAFAALPRPTVIGVAMARSSNLSHRIERLLNESSFRQAFAGSRGRVLLAVLLVPVALFAGTAMIRVQAAGSGRAVEPPQAAPTTPASSPAQSTPEQPAGQASESAAPVSTMPPAPATPTAPAPPTVSGFTVIPAGAPATPPLPPVPGGDDTIVMVGKGQTMTIAGTQDKTVTNTYDNGKHAQSTSVGRGYAYSYSSDRDSWALVTGPSEHLTFSGDWSNYSRDTIDKARKLTSGKFLWFTRNGKSYFLDDPAIMAQIEAMYKPMETLGRQQEALGKQQEELGKRQEELGRKQEQASVPTPDISKEMARLNEAVAKLDAKKGSTVSQEELADIEGKMGEIQGRLGALQGEMGAKQGEFGAMQGQLGAEQGKLGAEQGRLGAEQGRIAAEADRKVRSIIDESLHNGKARPVE